MVFSVRDICYAIAATFIAATALHMADKVFAGITAAQAGEVRP